MTKETLTRDFTPGKSAPPMIDHETAVDDFEVGASHTSASGRKLIQKWEGLYLKAYYDPVGVVTIGYGSINNAQLGIRVRMGDTITKEQADEYMMRELVDMEKQVVKLLKVPLKQHEFDSIMSFTYNGGVGNLKRSTILKLINAGKKDQVGEQFMRWVKARDRRTNQYVTLKGLVNRRNDERAMWEGRAISGIPPEKKPPTLPKQDIAPVVKPATQSAKEVMDTNEGKAAAGTLATTLSGSAVYIGQLLQNPWVAFSLGVVVTGVAFGLYLMWRNRREYVK